MLTPCVLTTLASSTPNDDAVEPAPGKTPLLFAAAVGSAPSPATKLPLFVLPAQLTPRSRPALRSTSRMRTFSMTCCEGETFIALTTGASGERPFATSTARAGAKPSLLARQ
jgi:hypothetical protein